MTRDERDAARDVRLHAATKTATFAELYSADRATIHELRRAAGTLRPITRFLGDGRSRWSRFLWWAVDAEYTRF
jgi:hypothetical protein